jgi:hypothetical protein
MPTIFSTLKPFRNPHIAAIQRNALISWTLLHPRPEIIIFGNEEGSEEICRELGLTQVPHVERNEFGTPLVKDIFGKGQKLAKNDILCYVNADIILTSSFNSALKHIQEWKRDFLVVGQRWDADIRQCLNFADPGWEGNLRKLVAQTNILREHCWIDYFIFKRGVYDGMPAFALGRSAWDNWLVWNALKRGASLIDGTEAIFAVHQRHNYSHIKFWDNARLQNPEMLRNLKLMGDWSKSCTIAHSRYVMTDSGIRKTIRWRYFSAFALLRFWELMHLARRLSYALHLSKNKAETMKPAGSNHSIEPSKNMRNIAGRIL